MFVTNEMYVRQPFSQILNSGGKTLTTVVMWGRSLEYSKQPANTTFSESRRWTQPNLQTLNESIRVYWELEQN